MSTINVELFKEETLTPAAKLFYLWLCTQPAEILSKGNVYFANEFDVTSMTINNWLFSLEKVGYLEIKYYKRNRTLICKN